MIFEGEHSVMQAIFEKRRLIETAQDHSHIRPLLIQGGGLMRGVYGVGAAIALEELGYSKAFSTLVGISSGAPIIAYFAAGKARAHLPALLNECMTSRIINPWRIWNQVDSKHFIKQVEQHPEMRLPAEAVFAHPAETFFAVTEYKTAHPKLIKPRDAEHLFQAIHASVNMQNVSSAKVYIDGIKYADGGFSRPHAISEVSEQLKPTHILLVTNNDRNFIPISPVERILNRTLFRLRLNGVLTQAINARREARDEAIAGLVAGDVPTAVVWGDGSVKGVERNTAKLAATIEASRTWWHGLLSLESIKS
jgi:predicted patatin/cPLA2 family phospholipase